MAALPCPLCEESKRTEPVWARPEGLHGQRARQFFRCGRCDLTFSDPAAFPTEAEEKAHYAHHENNPDDPRYADFLNRALAPLAERLAPGSKGLDFGSGPGPAAARILGERGHTVTNYDPFFAPDSGALWKSYDFIVSTEVIEHFRKPREEFVLLDQLLKPRGHMALMTETLEPQQVLEQWWYARDPTHLCFYSRKTLEHLARWLQYEAEYPHKNVVIYRKRG